MRQPGNVDSNTGFWAAATANKMVQKSMSRCTSKYSDGRCKRGGHRERCGGKISPHLFVLIILVGADGP